MIMRRTIVSAFATLLATASLTLSAYAQSSTAFTYQGYLQDNNNPANGTYDLKFTLYDAATEGNAIGNPVFIEDLQIQNGLFTVEVDFGTAPFAQGQRRWIEIAVRPGDSTDDHTTLDPRIELTPVPYALYAQNVAADAVSADQLANDPNALSKVSGGKLSITPNGFLKNNSRHVYFYVRYDLTNANPILTARPNDPPGWYPIKFPLTAVVANVGGGQYDEATGFYTVPTSGFYQISFVSRGANPCVWWSTTFELVKGAANERLAFATARREPNSGFDNGSLTISGVYYLQQGDQIRFRQDHVANTCLRGPEVFNTYLTIYLLSAADVLRVTNGGKPCDACG
jgi:hypothetical protein